MGSQSPRPAATPQPWTASTSDAVMLPGSTDCQTLRPTATPLAPAVRAPRVEERSCSGLCFDPPRTTTGAVAGARYLAKALDAATVADFDQIGPEFSPDPRGHRDLVNGNVGSRESSREHFRQENYSPPVALTGETGQSLQAGGFTGDAHEFPSLPRHRRLTVPHPRPPKQVCY